MRLKVQKAIPNRILLAQKKAPILEKLARKKQVKAGTEFGKGLPKKEEIAFVNNDKSYISEQLNQKL